MKNSHGLVLDIETLPKEATPTAITEQLLVHKTRNWAADKVEMQKLHYRFHEPQFAKVVCIGTLFDDGEGNIHRQQFSDMDNEENVVREFIEYTTQYCDNYMHARFVHFNGLDFDVPFLLYKCAEYEIVPPARFCNLIRFRSDVHYDIMQLLSAWGKFAISLREACISFGVTDPKESLNNVDTLSFLASASEKEILQYNMADVESTYKVFKKVIKIYQ